MEPRCSGSENEKGEGFDPKAKVISLPSRSGEITRKPPLFFWFLLAVAVGGRIQSDPCSAERVC